MTTALYRWAALWTAFGLASGLFYREFTKLNGVPGGTQLAVVHTHALTLGTIVLLVALALALALPALAERGAFRVFVWVWNIGLAIATLGMLTKGILQVSGNALATSDDRRHLRPGPHDPDRGLHHLLRRARAYAQGPAGTAPPGHGADPPGLNA